MANDKVSIWDGLLKFGRHPEIAEILYGNGQDFTLQPINIVPITSKTTTYGIQTSDCIIDCTSGTFTVTLPTAVGIKGQYFIIKNSGTGIITLATTGGQTIDGSTTRVSAVQYEAVTVVSDGANWKVI